MQSKSLNVQKLIFTAMLAAVSGVLMSLEFSVPMMPPFYKVDFSDVPSLIATLIMGPAAGFSVCRPRPILFPEEESSTCPNS